MQPGDIGVTTGSTLTDRVIQLGQHLHGDGAASKWNHAFVIVDNDGGTIEAQAAGVVRSEVSRHPHHVLFECPAGVNRAEVVKFAIQQLGTEYDWIDIVALGIDCLLHTKLHEHTDAWICSELAAAALIAGGWKPPLQPALTMPADLFSELIPKEST